ncbi:MAG: phosphoglucosamine mutase [Candidatus Falkowbacteria bacterium]|nr:phosphoglucosamine mutase [Candidatus Falkowbacteria bacterium]
MPLIKSISGIRGTLGDAPGENLTKTDVIKFTAAFASLLKEKNWGDLIILGRDARPSGQSFRDLIIKTLLSLNFRVTDLGLVATPTVEMAVIYEKAAGGIIITASHNPIEWNALKLLNSNGEFLSREDGERVLKLADKQDQKMVDKILNADINLISDSRNLIINNDYGQRHIAKILKLKLVDPAAIKKVNFKIVVDGINSVGGLIIPELLKALGVDQVIKLNCEPNGQFVHNPEPLEKNLQGISSLVVQKKADIGIVVDPDVDRLAFVSEDGTMFGEEYTLVAVADYVLKNYSPCYYQKISVSNLSSSRALKDVSERHGGSYEAAAVGEINVVAKMKEAKAVIGGEGNGGVILPGLHYGRDALVGVALFLSALAQSEQKISKFRRNFPEYFMVKDKLELTPNIDVSALLGYLKDEYKKPEYQADKITDIDGIKIDFPKYWLHLRASNTEPIIRIYGEAKDWNLLNDKISKIKSKILAYIK